MSAKGALITRSVWFTHSWMDGLFCSWKLVGSSWVVSSTRMICMFGRVNSWKLHQMPTFHTLIVLKHRRSKRKASKATGAENSDLPMAQPRGGSVSFGSSPETTQLKMKNIIASRKTSIIQGILGCTPIPTWAPHGKSLYIGHNPQESLGVHPNRPLNYSEA